MRINLDDKHNLVSDAFCFWIEETVIPKEGKQKPYTRRVSGYRADFEGCVVSYINNKIRSSEAAEISELAQEIRELKEEVLAWKPKS